jgi:hypothetical protein
MIVAGVWFGGIRDESAIADKTRHMPRFCPDDVKHSSNTNPPLWQRSPHH